MFYIAFIDYKFIKVPAYLDRSMDSEVNPKMFETQLSTNQTLNRSLRLKFEKLLLNKMLPDQIPIIFCERKQSQQGVSEALDRMQNWRFESNINETHRKVWPHLMAMKSLIFVGNTEFLPELLYLKPLCWLIRVNIFI